MSADQQEEVFRAFADPAFYPHPVGEVRQRETHISRVFLTGRFVYKLKKAVDLGFLDYSTLDKRWACCKQETELNRRLSNNVYLGVVAVTQQEGRLVLGGAGPPVEYVVRMRQLPEEMSLNRRLRAQGVGSADLAALARKLVRFYAGATAGPDVDVHGTWDAVRSNCEENFSQTETFVGQRLDERMYQIVRAATRAYLRRRKALFHQRVAEGRIRDGHGDLRSGHIYLHDGIQIIDCIEFNDRFRCGDVISDLAFLAMDLDFEGFPDTAQGLVDAYAAGAQDPQAYILLDFYKGYRAMVRAKVACFRSEELSADSYEYRKNLREAQRFLELAYGYALRCARPTLWVVCGLPASGKSTIALELGRILGIPLLRSDVVRKELFGFKAEEQHVLPYGKGIYSEEADALTYGRLLLLAQEALSAGNSMILDATFGAARRREEALRLARDHDANLLFVECRAPDSVRRERLRQRRQAASVSDAREEHFEQLQARYEPLENIREELRIQIDSNKNLQQNLSRILRHDCAILSAPAISSTAGDG